MIFYTSDLHFGHKKIINYCNRPFFTVKEMNKEIINNWNNKVKDKDEVYILGDFGFVDGKEANELLSKLKGTKYLIIGNHDKFLSDVNFDKSNFKGVYHYHEIMDGNKRVILFHYPIFEWNGFYNNTIHLFGHVHNNDKFYSRVPEDFRGRAFNVGVDVNNFEPVSLEEILERENK